MKLFTFIENDRAMKSRLTHYVVLLVLLATQSVGLSQKFGFGWKSEPPGRVKAYYHVTAEYRNTAPLQSSDYSAALPHRLNQGSLGSCVAHGSIAGYAVAYWQQTHKALDIKALSRLGLYYDCRDYDGTVNQDAGSYISTGAWVLKNIGIGNDKTWPYIERNFKLKPPTQYYKESLGAVAIETLAIDASTKSARHKGIIAALSNKRAVVMGGLVDSHIYNVGKDGWEEPYKAPYIGGHCRAIIGHDDKLTHKYYIVGKTYKGFYLVVNSWGSGWGKNGMSWVPYETIDDPNVYDDFVVYVTVTRLSSYMPRSQSLLAPAITIASL